jgi:hypothetical protein
MSYKLLRLSAGFSTNAIDPVAQNSRSLARAHLTPEARSTHRPLAPRPAAAFAREGELHFACEVHAPLHGVATNGVDVVASTQTL